MELHEHYRECREKIDNAERYQSENPDNMDSSRRFESLLHAEKNASAFTRLHTERVAMMSYELAKASGYNEEESANIREAARLHDIGKTMIPDEIMHKPGRLTSEEREIIQTHTTHGVDILTQRPGPLANLASIVALYHHERWDGKGYFGLKGNEIPKAARIVQIVDVFEAMTADRPYFDKRNSSEDVLEMMTSDDFEGKRGPSQNEFDPILLNNFKSIALDLFNRAERLYPVSLQRQWENKMPNLGEDFGKAAERPKVLGGE